MEKTPRISIVTACYNSEKTIEQTIQSVLNQTYPNIEYIIVDGASTDGTMKIVDKYRDRIDVVISESDNGVYDAFNKGIRNASGDIIEFLNSDDYLYQNLIIEEVANLFIENPNLKIVYGNILVINETTGHIEIRGKSVNINEFQNGIAPPHPGQFVKKQLFEQYGYFNEKYKIASDFEFTIAIFKDYLNESYYLDEIVTVFRVGGLSSDLSTSEMVVKETKEIIENVFGNSIFLKKSNQDLNLEYIKKWLETFLFFNRPVTEVLKKKNIQNVAIFGTREMALYFMEDLYKSGITVKSFLDNDKRREGLYLRQVPINSPEWIKNNSSSIDAVIYVFEGNYEEEITNQIKIICGEIDFDIFSWKEIIELNYK